MFLRLEKMPERDEEYYHIEDNEEVDVIISYNREVSLSVEENEHHEILEEIEEMHRRDEQDAWAWRCWLEIENHRKMYNVQIFDLISFYQFSELFFK